MSSGAETVVAAAAATPLEAAAAAAVIKALFEAANAGPIPPLAPLSAAENGQWRRAPLALLVQALRCLAVSYIIRGEPGLTRTLPPRAPFPTAADAEGRDGEWICDMDLLVLLHISLRSSPTAFYP